MSVCKVMKQKVFVKKPSYELLCHCCGDARQISFQQVQTEAYSQAHSGSLLQGKFEDRLDSCHVLVFLLQTRYKKNLAMKGHLIFLSSTGQRQNKISNESCCSDGQLEKSPQDTFSRESPTGIVSWQNRTMCTFLRGPKEVL